MLYTLRCAFSAGVYDFSRICLSDRMRGIAHTQPAQTEQNRLVLGGYVPRATLCFFNICTNSGMTETVMVISCTRNHCNAGERNVGTSYK